MTKDILQTRGANTDVWDVLNNVKHTVSIIVDNIYSQPQPDLFHQQYHFLLQDIVYQMTALPSDREEIGLEPVSDNADVAVAYNEIMDTITLAFGISKQQVEKDMVQYTRKYTVDDIRTVRDLRKNNMLH